MAKTMTLKEWIEKVGAADVAKLLKTTRASINHWRAGRCLPQSKHMHLIHKYSRGAVTYDGMIDSYHGSKTKK